MKRHNVNSCTAQITGQEAFSVHVGQVYGWAGGREEQVVRIWTGDGPTEVQLSSGNRMLLVMLEKEVTEGRATLRTL